MPAANLAVVPISISSRHVVQRSLLLGTAGQPRQEPGAVAGTALSGDRAIDGECAILHISQASFTNAVLAIDHLPRLRNNRSHAGATGCLLPQSRRQLRYSIPRDKTKCSFLYLPVSGLLPQSSTIQRPLRAPDAPRITAKWLRAMANNSNPAGPG